MDGREFLKPESMYTIMASIFKFGTFLSVALAVFFFMLSIHLVFLLCSFCYHILFPLYPLVHLSLCFFIDVLLEFSFVILEYPILFELIDPVPVSFEFSFFYQYLLIYFFQLDR